MHTHTLRTRGATSWLTYPIAIGYGWKRIESSSRIHQKKNLSWPCLLLLPPVCCMDLHRERASLSHDLSHQNEETAVPGIGS